MPTHGHSIGQEHCRQIAYYYSNVRVGGCHRMCQTSFKSITNRWLLLKHDQINTNLLSNSWPLSKCIKSTLATVPHIAHCRRTCNQNQVFIISKDTLVAIISKTIRQMLQTYGHCKVFGPVECVRSVCVFGRLYMSYLVYHDVFVWMTKTRTAIRLCITHKLEHIIPWFVYSHWGRYTLAHIV